MIYIALLLNNYGFVPGSDKGGFCPVLPPVSSPFSSDPSPGIVCVVAWFPVLLLVDAVVLLFENAKPSSIKINCNIS